MVDYPDRANTRLIMDLARREALDGRELPPPARPVTQEIVFEARRETLGLTLADSVADYIAALVDATTPARNIQQQADRMVALGCQPACGNFHRTRSACARLAGRTRLRQPRGCSGYRAECAQAPAVA